MPMHMKSGFGPLHRKCWPYQVYLNNDPKMAITYLMTRTNLIPGFGKDLFYPLFRKKNRVFKFRAKVDFVTKSFRHPSALCQSICHLSYNCIFS